MELNEKIFIIAGGSLNDPNYHRNLIADDDYVICVNGGTIHALTMGINPNVIIGDLDSLPKEIIDKIKSSNVDIKQFPSAKDKSDLELAIDFAVTMQPPRIVIAGALGGKRVDHFFVNLLLLTIPQKNNIPAAIIDENHHIEIINEYMKVEGSPGDYLSLFPVTEAGAIVTTKGLKYQLSGERLTFASSRGLSNEMLHGLAEVKVEFGLLMVIKSKK